MLMKSGENAATLVYGPNGFRIVRTGRFVLCAVTGEPVALEELRYWSVERQEAICQRRDRHPGAYRAMMGRGIGRFAVLAVLVMGAACVPLADRSTQQMPGEPSPGDQATAPRPASAPIPGPHTRCRACWAGNVHL